MKKRVTEIVFVTLAGINGRVGEARTRDPMLPKHVRYQLRYRPKIGVVLMREVRGDQPRQNGALRPATTNSRYIRHLPQPVDTSERNLSPRWVVVFPANGAYRAECVMPDA